MWPKTRSGLEVIVYSGASRTIVSLKHLVELGLHANRRQLINVRGVKTAVAFGVHPGVMNVCGVDLLVEPIVFMDDDKVPSLLGLPELKRLDCCIDLENMSLTRHRVRKTKEMRSVYGRQSRALVNMEKELPAASRRKLNRKLRKESRRLEEALAFEEVRLIRRWKF